MTSVSEIVRQLLAENRRLQDTVDDLRADIAQREAGIAANEAAGRRLGLTIMQAKIFAELFRKAGRIVSRETLFSRCYDCDTDTNPRVIEVVLCSIRQKLGRYGVKVKTVWGSGYVLSVEDKDRLDRLLRMEGSFDVQPVATLVVEPDSDGCMPDDSDSAREASQ